MMGRMQTEQRTLTRRKNGRLIAGVAGGLADFTGTPAKWWRWAFVGVAVLGWLGFMVIAPAVLRVTSDTFAARLAFLVILLAGGIAEWIYLALWILLPRIDRPQPASFSERLETWPGRAGLGLAIFGAGLVGQWLQLWGGAVVLASLLIGAGVAIFRRGGEREPSDEPASWNAGPEASAVLEGESAVTREMPATAERRPRVRKERSKLGWLFLGLAFVVGGLVWLLDASGTTHLSASQMIAAPVVVLAIGLLVGSMFGHAKWTFLFALLLAPAMIVAGAIGMPLTGTYADRVIHPTSGSELQSNYVLTGGELDFDLTDLPPGAHPAPVHAAIGVGQIRVMTSPCNPVDITAAVNAGNIQLFGGQGHSRGGFSATGVYRTNGTDPIVMDLRAGIGEIDVERGYMTKKQREACSR
jgi:phage shock protein PspC (stress-responsive transcriptional regulator)